MESSMKDYLDFLTPRGMAIYKAIRNHCKKYGIEEVDHMEMAILANSFDLYATNAKICNETGQTQHPKEGGWDQVRPEYTIMKQEYGLILKHSGKFGLNPADRERIFSSAKEPKKKVGFNLN
jgi:phage terminase small subunit